MGTYSIRASNFLKRNYVNVWQAIVNGAPVDSVSLLDRWEGFVFYARQIQLSPEVAAEQFVEIVAGEHQA